MGAQKTILTRSAVILSLLAVSISFGLIKQIKTAWQSIDLITESAQDIGLPFFTYKQQLMERHPQSSWRFLHVAYATDRGTNGLSKEGRPNVEFRYDAQYGMAPIIFRDNPRRADYLVLDFENPDAFDEYVRLNALDILASSDLTALVTKAK